MQPHVPRSAPPSSATAPRGRQSAARVLLLPVSVAVLVAVALLWAHPGAAGIYARHVFGDLPEVQPRFETLSPAMDEAALQKHLAPLPLVCADTPTGRACGADVRRSDGVAALRLQADFAQSRLACLALDLPWWSHHAALREVLAMYGAPETMDDEGTPRPFVRWRVGSGWLALDRNPGYDPLRPRLLQWCAAAPATTGSSPPFPPTKPPP